MKDGDALCTGDLWVVDGAIVALTDVVGDVLNLDVAKADGVWRRQMACGESCPLKVCIWGKGGICLSYVIMTISNYTLPHKQEKSFWYQSF